MSSRLALVTGFLAAVLTGPVVPGGTVVAGSVLDVFSNLNLLPVSQEQELSRRFAREVESKHRMVRDERIAGLVSNVGRRLVSGIRRPQFSYRFRVVEDRSVNAFNIGGGYVYVHTGLIDAAQTEAQLASVIAHEIGHQVERHVAKAISREQAFRTLAAFAVGEKSSQWVRLAARLGITTGQLHFSRGAEREADDVMLELLVRGGYDPREALRMFETIHSVQRGDPGRVASIFSSHPPTSERLQNLRSRIGRMRLPRDLTRDTRRFQTARRLVRGG